MVAHTRGDENAKSATIYLKEFKVLLDASHNAISAKPFTQYFHSKHPVPQLPTNLLKTSTSPSSLAALIFNASLAICDSFSAASSSLMRSTRFWRYMRAARVLSLRFWMPERGTFFEGGDSKDEESGGFGDREFE